MSSVHGQGSRFKKRRRQGKPKKATALSEYDICEKWARKTENHQSDWMNWMDSNIHLLDGLSLYNRERESFERCIIQIKTSENIILYHITLTSHGSKDKSHTSPPFWSLVHQHQSPEPANASSLT